jgi:CrcB protein
LLIDWASVGSVAVGGAIGSVVRYLLSVAAIERFGPAFPYGTFAINVAGSFLIGIVAQLALSRAFGVSPEVRVFLAVGVLGGFTTFSSFSMEAVTLIRNGANVAALAYVAGSVVLGLLAAYAGVQSARLVAP